MNFLYRTVTDTLIFGRKTLELLECKNSCVDDQRCSINNDCECEWINFSKCPSKCDTLTGQCRSMFRFFYLSFQINIPFIHFICLILFSPEIAVKVMYKNWLDDDFDNRTYSLLSF